MRSLDAVEQRIAHPRDISHLDLARSLLADHEPLTEKIRKATDLDAASVPLMLRDVLRFLHLIAWSELRLTPPRLLDLAWHEFILFTKAYASHCQSQFGRFIHHTPGGSVDENQRQLKATLSLYHALFGPPDPQFWGDQGFYNQDVACGACEAIDQ